MGCDIHAFLEVGTTNGGAADAVFAGEALLLPRDYEVFRALAGVRCGEGCSPLYPARGLPSDVSECVFEHYYLFVIDEADEPLYRGWDWVSLADAAASEQLPMNAKPSGRMSAHGYTPYPDWHTPSFLYLAEIRDALRHAGVSADQLPPQYEVVLQTLQATECLLGRRTRLVFWFDN
jgi:hypothetical protein